MVNITQLRALCEVVREGSFAGAGRRLGYTSSAVSQQIAGLERVVGVTLFEREAHGIRATTAARYVAAQGEELLMRLGDFDARLAGLADGAHGHLRLGSFPTANSRIIPQVLASVMTAYPDADVELDEGNTGHLVAGVVEGHVDIAIVHVYALVPERWPAGLAGVELMTEDLLLVMPVEHPRANAEDFRLEDLRHDRWISSQDETDAARCLRRICAAHGFVPAVAFRSDDYDVVQGLVRGGAGVAIVPEMGYTPQDRVYSAPLRQWTPGRRILALYRSANSNPLLPKGIEALREVCAR
ncbi:LysR family transcriptional regulator [Saccharopolyspora pogona]|uniref:LysR family transcriptional regulator n=1 Tax=Saccharopolyspora pogona TaxID=333966 RepID=UPI00168371AE|nr:LysR family transcriptional regulator [Saccharopolyspora pogona]